MPLWASKAISIVYFIAFPQMQILKTLELVVLERLIETST